MRRGPAGRGPWRTLSCPLLVPWCEQLGALVFLGPCSLFRRLVTCYLLLVTCYYVAMKRYHIWTEGCQMNVADSAKLAAGLDRFGWQAIDRPEGADLVVLNTCVVRERSELRAVSKLGSLKAMKRKGEGNFQIVVMGCMVGPKDDELRRRFPYVDHFARPQAFEGIFDALGLTEDTGGEFWPTTFPAPTGPTAYVPIIEGCDKFCTYCIVPFRRGRERSRPVLEIREEVAHLVHGGAREVTLLGQTVEA